MKKNLFVLVVLFSAFLFPLTASAVSDSWSGGGNSGEWGSTGNWAGGNPPGTGDTATFDSAGNGQTTIDLAGQTVHIVYFDTASAATYTIGAGGVGVDTLTLDSGGTIRVANGVVNSQTINANVTLLGNAYFRNDAANASGGLLIVAGTVTGAAGGGTLTLDGSNTDANTVSGNIVNGAAALGVTKSGAGTWVLSGTNTYTGTTTINAGTLELSGGSAIANAGAVSLANVSGAILKLNASETIGILSGGGTTGGNVNLQSYTLTVNEASDTTYAGVLSGTGGALTKAGTGTLTLTGSNTYTGATTVSAGKLLIDHGASGSHDYFASSGISIASGATFEINQTSGTTRLSDASKTVTGTGTFSKTGAGETILANDTADTIVTFNQSAGGLINVQAGTLSYFKTATTNLGSLTVASGAMAVLDNDDQQGANSYFDELNGGGNINYGGGTSARTITLGVNNGDGDFSGVIVNGSSTAVSLTKTGTGTQILSGANTFTGATLISNGTLQIGDAGTTGSLSSSSAITNNGTLVFNRTNTVTQGTDFATGITGSGALTQAGTGTLILNSANTYTGATTISAGTVQVSNAGALGTGATADVTNGGTLDVGTTDLSVGGNYAQTGTLKVTANSAADYGSLASAGTGNVAGTISVLMNGYVANGATLDIGNFAGGLTYDPLTTVMLDPLGDQHGTLTGALFGTDILRLTMDRSTNGFASDAAGDPNAAAVGAVLDNIQNPTGDILSVLSALDAMTSSEVAAALATMVPDMSSGIADASRILSGQGFTMISNRLGGVRGSGFAQSGVSSGEMLDGTGVWMQGLGNHTKQDARKGIEGFQANTFGTTIGADRLVSNHVRLGAAGGYGYADVKSKTPGSPSDNINSYIASVYGSYDSLDLCEARAKGKNSREAVRNQGDDFWYVDGMMSFTQNSYDSRREIWIGADKRVAKAEHYGQQYSTEFEAGYTFTFEETKALEVTPFTTLGYNYLYMNKYKEKGADSMNLTVDGQGYNQLEQGLGTKLAYPIVNKKMGTFIPSAKAAWLYDYIGDRFETTASFAGGGASFNTKGAKPAKNGLLFGAEIAFLNKGNMTVTGNWDLELKDQFASNTYYGTVRYDF